MRGVKNQSHAEFLVRLQDGRMNRLALALIRRHLQVRSYSFDDKDEVVRTMDSENRRLKKVHKLVKVRQAALR